MNIYDIAELAGVSIATVSRVISGNAKVRPETRAKIEAIMKEHNYSPSMIARGMNSKSLKTIAIAVLSFSNSHHMKIAHEVLSVFSKMEYNVVIYEAGSSIDDVMAFFNRMKDISIDGIVLVSSLFSLIGNDYDKVINLLGDIPVIIANGWVQGMYGVLVDEDAGCVDAVNHLVEKGIKQIYYINSNHTESSIRKYRGYRSAVLSNNLDEHSIEINKGYSEDDVRNALSRIDFASGQIGIICDEDILALHVVKYIQKMGLRIPEDVSIIGYNDSTYCDLVLPHLSSIDNKAHTLGQKCAEYLSIALKDGTLGDKRILDHIKPELVLRGSSI